MIHPALVREARKRLGMGDPIDEHNAQQTRLAMVTADRATPHANRRLVGVRASHHDDIAAPSTPRKHYCPPKIARDCHICTPSAKDRNGPVSRARAQRDADNRRIAAQHEARVRDARMAMGEPVDPWSRTVDDEASRLIVVAESRGESLPYSDAYREAGRRMAHRRTREYADYRADVEVS